MELNHQHEPFQGSALPIELPVQLKCTTNLAEDRGVDPPAIHHRCTCFQGKAASRRDIFHILTLAFPTRFELVSQP